MGLASRSRDLPVGLWGVFFSVGGATLVSLLGTISPFHLTVILNYTIFGNFYIVICAYTIDNGTLMPTSNCFS